MIYELSPYLGKRRSYFMKQRMLFPNFFRFNEEKEELLIPKWLFDETKLVVIRLPFPPRNEKFNKRFISKLQILPMAKSDLTLFGIPTRYSPFSIIKIRYNI